MTSEFRPLRVGLFSGDDPDQRLKSIEVRKELTDEWEKRGVQRGMDFAVLTAIIAKAWSGRSVKEYKKHKNLKKKIFVTT